MDGAAVVGKDGTGTGTGCLSASSPGAGAEVLCPSVHAWEQPSVFP